jgi:hypothetical protein
MSQPVLEFEYYKNNGYPFYKKVLSDMTEDQQIEYTYNNIYKRIHNCNNFVAWRDTKCSSVCGLKKFYVIALNVIAVLLVIFSLSFNKKVKTSLFEPLTLLESNVKQLNDLTLITAFLTYVISLVLLSTWEGSLNIIFFVFLLVLLIVLLTECILFYNMMIQLDSSQYDTFRNVMLFYIVLIILFILVHCFLGYKCMIGF